MADYTSDRTGASIDTVLDNADAGNIGKTTTAISDADAAAVNSFETWSFIGSNKPSSAATIDSPMISVSRDSTRQGQLFFDCQNNNAYLRSENSSVFSAWQELYHTGNTGAVTFNGPTIIGSAIEGVNISFANLGLIQISTSKTIESTHLAFNNPNGKVGSITTSGTATAYNTSSDPRLKDFKDAPIDSAIDTEFDKLFSCFRAFNWKNDPTGDLVWGFDAHACIDAGTDLGSEGEGPRELSLGDVYKTDKAEVDKDGVETKAAVEHKVSPAGVDQSKAVPILLAKIEQLERRLKALEV